jgi:hypothetical protein
MRTVAKSLNEARREAAERTAASIRRLERNGGLDTDKSPRQRRLIDRRELRGWPAAGRGICGAIAETIPGWNLFDDE